MDQIKARVTKKDLVILVPIQLLKFFAENNPRYDDYSGDSLLSVLDLPRFSKEVLEHLLSEKQEDGSTFLTDCLDQAIDEVVESGDESIYFREEA